MEKRKIPKNIYEGVQKTLSSFLVRPVRKKQILEIEITPDVKIFTNRYMTVNGIITERIIKITDERKKGFIKLV